MLHEGAIVGGEKVGTVNAEGAVVEVADVVNSIADAVPVLVKGHLYAAAVVAEQGVGGLDDAAGMFVHSVGVRAAGGDGVAGVLHRRVVQDDAPLPLCVLGQTGVALHDDALPHLALAGVGQRAAIHDQLPARTDDEAGRVNYFQGASYGQRCKTVNHNVLVHLSGKIPRLGRRNNIRS